ncbi:MAG: large subunit ribosomal protein L9 [Maricaulis maris]|jgi:large subunit ribosomal protein L9|uniref:Large ribosomal subunit protein bL9 n=1 Tax=Maricaulis maris (strain MCS10) TaxID=394221 RepID=RL9_MARMM|nr:MULTISPECIES: 50S ribosomal protein L9 [Maricaulis]Q0AQD4.1 RecName: Full=Large ribosomal subunit protein bL9; AltName: Full=50S ribosomal protein L9 [Maricaulis maris MCS10]ABI65503.1 LSU ribosomal protein L9P [Maricaulis maris MCS10]MAC89287.1 50S ribosomal protein L9 [Maricaulis sp.]
MKLVLLERVENLGVIGDVVSVRPGFARNFLLPQGKALRATEANMARFEVERELLEKRNAERAAEAAESGKTIDGESFVMIRQAGESGQLYGSVTSRDIAEIVSESGTKVVRSQIALNAPIKTLGLHELKIKLHADVSVTVTINIARSQDEAERQAAGEDVIAAQADEDRAIADAQAAELFEASEEGQELAAQREATEDAGADESEETEA